MPGVTHIQIQASLYFDDGFVVTLSSPLLHKDIRHGDYFQDEQIGDFLSSAGINMAEIVSTKSSSCMHDEVMVNHKYGQLPTYWRRPNYEKPFSDN